MILSRKFTIISFPHFRSQLKMRVIRLPQSYLRNRNATRCSFVGLICVEEAYSERIRDIVSRKDEFHVGWAAIFMQISSWLMLAMGVLYMLLGICCLKHLKDKMRDDEREAWRNYRRDMKQWKELYQD